MKIQCEIELHKDATKEELHKYNELLEGLHIVRTFVDDDGCHWEKEIAGISKVTVQ